MRSQIFAEFLNRHRFIIGLVADVRDGLRVIFEDDEVGADAVEEPAIVADNEGDTCEFADGFFEGALIAQLLLQRGIASAAIAIDSAPPSGVFTTLFPSSKPTGDISRRLRIEVRRWS